MIPYRQKGLGSANRDLPARGARRLPRNFVARETKSGDWHLNEYEAPSAAHPVASLAQLPASAHRPPGVLRLSLLGLYGPGVAKILETVLAIIHPPKARARKGAR